MDKEQFIIEEKLSDDKLMSGIIELNRQYAGDIVRHVKSDGQYVIEGFVVLNQNGLSEYAVLYRSYLPGQQPPMGSARHIRPCHEFFDGRFVKEPAEPPRLT